MSSDHRDCAQAPWRWLNTGEASGPFNMALDEAMLTLYQQGLVPATVRVYQWCPPCVSLGYFQPARDIDQAACRRNGYDLVRRPTGGRAILHADELTYSVVASEASLGASGVLATYRRIVEGIILGLRRLGIESGLQATPRGAPDGLHGSCFASTARCDLTVGGEKLAGSAQLRRKGCLLQHGSLPFSFEEAALRRVLANGGPNGMARHRVVDLDTVAGGNLSFDAVASALRQGFEQSLGVTFVEAELTSEERRLAASLVAGKYGTPTWTNRR